MNSVKLIYYLHKNFFDNAVRSVFRQTVVVSSIAVVNIEICAVNIKIMTRERYMCFLTLF